MHEGRALSPAFVHRKLGLVVNSLEIGAHSSQDAIPLIARARPDRIGWTWQRRNHDAISCDFPLKTPRRTIAAAMMQHDRREIGHRTKSRARLSNRGANCDRTRHCKAGEHATRDMAARVKPSGRATADPPGWNSKRCRHGGGPRQALDCGSHAGARRRGDRRGNRDCHGRGNGHEHDRSCNPGETGSPSSIACP